MAGMARVAFALMLVMVAVQARRPHQQVLLETEELATPKEVGRKVGATAGAERGAAVGAVEGTDAAEKAVKDTLSQLTIDKQFEVPEYTEIGFPRVLAAEVPPKPSPEMARLAEKNPGAVNYFKQFDGDVDNRWTREDFYKAIDRAKTLRYLPSEFNAEGEWNSLEKDAEGRITLNEYLRWTARTAAHSPPKKFITLPPRYTITKAFKFANCEEAFALYDADHDGVWDLNEFKRAVNGRVADDHIVEKFTMLPKLGPREGTLAIHTWVEFCVALTGLPAGPNIPAKPTLACVPNPCREAGTVCMEDPQVCLVGFACPQHRCIRLRSRTGSAIARSYENCTKSFQAFDSNKDNRLTEQEFREGVHFKRGVNFPARRRFSVKKSWAHLHKDFDQMVSMYEFVTFCVAKNQEGRDDGGVARAECWDVFHHFDRDASMDIDAGEYSRGMNMAKRQGHVPISLNVDLVWKTLPKSNSSRVMVGPFIKWCLDVSRGIDSLEAARTTLELVGGVTNLPATISSQISYSYMTNTSLTVAWKNGTVAVSYINGTVADFTPGRNRTVYFLPVHGVLPNITGVQASIGSAPTTISGSQILVGSSASTSTSKTSTSSSSSSTSSTSSTTSSSSTKVSMQAPDLLSNVARSVAGSLTNLASIVGLKKAAAAFNPGSQYVESTNNPLFCVNLFRLADNDANGFVFRDEFHRVCVDLYPEDACKDFPAIFFKGDTNRDGKLEPAEWNQLCRGAPKFEASQVGANQARQRVVEAAAQSGQRSGAEAGGAAGAAAGQAAGERAAKKILPPLHAFRSARKAVPTAKLTLANVKPTDIDDFDYASLDIDV